MATAKLAVPAPVKRDVLSEAGLDDCRIVSLLAGCYGSYAYMEASYGVTTERCALVMRGVNEMPDFIKEEHGVDVTVQDVLAIMREAWDAIEEHWDEQFW